MKTLENATIGQIYYIETIVGEGKTKLGNLGFISGKEISLMSTDGKNAIISSGGTRLAIGREFLNQIFIKNEPSTENIVSLSTLKIGQTGIVRFIDAQGETKRRLMDMGITRGTSIYVKKLAPLGDPIELHLRGYALSLRKIDAEKIKVLL